MNEELILAMSRLDEDKVLEIVRTMRGQGMNTTSIIHALNCGMLTVGEMFEKGTYYLADLIVSGSIYRQALSVISPENESLTEQTENMGKVLIGVVKNDIHDIGKDIIVGSLRSEGFCVVDLGINVPCEDFISAVVEYKPNILALSGTMTFAVDEMEMIIKSLNEKGLRNTVSVIVGGISVNKAIAERIGSDYYSEDPIETLALCRKLILR